MSISPDFMFCFVRFFGFVAAYVLWLFHFVVLWMSYLFERSFEFGHQYFPGMVNGTQLTLFGSLHKEVTCFGGGWTFLEDYDIVLLLILIAVEGSITQIVIFTKQLHRMCPSKRAKQFNVQLPAKSRWVFANPGEIVRNNEPEFMVTVPQHAVPCEVVCSIEQFDPRMLMKTPGRPEPVPILCKVYEKVLRLRSDTPRNAGLCKAPVFVNRRTGTKGSLFSQTRKTCSKFRSEILKLPPI